MFFFTRATLQLDPEYQAHYRIWSVTYGLFVILIAPFYNQIVLKHQVQATLTLSGFKVLMVMDVKPGN
jgi:hypothetical protein